LVLNFGVSAVLFHVVRQLSGKTWVSLLLSSLYLVSRFGYYTISQVWGIMEALGLTFAVVIAYLMWRFLKTGSGKYFWMSFTIFTLLVFIHERYVTMLIFFVIVLVLRGINRKTLLYTGLSALPVIVNFAIKKLLIGVNPLFGTGNTALTETFDFSQFIHHLISGVHYILGINAGPIHLNGIPSDQAPWYLSLLVLLGVACITGFGLVFLIHSARENRKNNIDHIKSIILFAAFILATLVGGSVTIRLEMRWIYTPFCGFLMLIAYLFGVLPVETHLRKIALILLSVWAILVFPTELIYRSYYPNLYYWKTQTAGNQLFELTIGQYGDDYWDYETYLICPDLKCPDLNYSEGDELHLFFSQFSQGKKVDHKISVVTDISEINPKLLSTNNVIVLDFDPTTFAVTEISH
jgi:hypothetical protein